MLRAPVGQRVEKTEQQVAEVERMLRANIPVDELETIVSSTGVLAQGRSSLFNPNTGPHTSVISVYLTSPEKRTRNQVQSHERGASEDRQIVPRRRDVFRSRGSGQARDQFRLAEVCGRGDLWL